MKLSKVKIENFRSIAKSEIDLKNYTVLLGENNEGKTNVFRAIMVAWDSLQSISNQKNTNSNFQTRKELNRNQYKFNRRKDYRLSKNGSKIHPCKISLIFKLTNEERDALNGKYKLNAKSDGHIMFTLYYSSEYHFSSTVSKVEVSNKKNLNNIKNESNRNATINFITNNFDINYIPSIRTENEIDKLVGYLITTQLQELEQSSEYRKAQEVLANLQREKLDEISSNIKKDINKYMKINDVKIESLFTNFNRSIQRSVKLLLDDGILTELSTKGDGVKSIVAISLIQENYASKENTLVLIDEPEAHLNSRSIRELNKTLREMTKSTQIFTATHHQIFANRNNISSNNLLKNGRTFPAKRIYDIRNTLGVTASENLINAELIIVLEGKSDINIFNKILISRNDKVKKLLEEDRLVLESTNGTKNVSTKINSLNSMICPWLLILDNDQAGREISNEIKDNNAFILPLLGEKEEMEIEDLINTNITFEIVANHFEIEEIKNRVTKGKKMKFSKQIEIILNDFGKDFNAHKFEIKNKIANDFIENYTEKTHLNNESIDFIDNLIDNILKHFEM